MTSISEDRSARLALEPLRTTGPADGTSQQLRDIWAHRQLLDMLIRRELKARYKDSTLGFVWSLLRPLALLLIYFIALGQFLGAARNIPDFAVFIYTGLTAWGLFAETVTTGTGSIVGNGGLIKKVYLPREIFPLSSLGSALFNFLIQLGILFVATIVVGDVPTGTDWFYLPLSLAVIIVTGLGWALLLAALNVYLRDIQYLVEIALMIAFWASPIVYSWALVVDQAGKTVGNLYLANPMTVAIMGFQQVFWVAGRDQPVPENLTGLLWIWLAVGVVFVWVAQRVFVRLQGNFAQEL